VTEVPIAFCTIAGLVAAHGFVGEKLSSVRPFQRDRIGTIQHRPLTATAATTAAPALANTANPLAGIEQQIRSSTGNDPQALQTTAISSVQALVTGDQAKADEARARAADAVAKAQGIPVEQARTQVEQYEKTYRDNMEAAKQQAIDAAQTATAAVSAGAILGFIALALGAIAGWFGGSYGTKRNVIVSETVTHRA
jgi:cobalamin biosynthesis Mg chelatase CobN